MWHVIFFSACCRKMLPRSLSEYSPVLNGVSSGWRREGGITSRKVISRSSGKEDALPLSWSCTQPVTAVQLCTATEEVEEVASLHPVSPVFLIIRKSSREMGKRDTDLLWMFLMLWAFHLLPFLKNATSTTAECLQLSSPPST